MPKREWEHPEFGTGPGFSRALEAPKGRTIYLAGQAPTGARGVLIGEGDPAAQADACLSKIRDLLEAAGGSMDDVVMLNVYVTDRATLAATDEVRARYFPARPFPAMSWYVVAGLADPAWLIEIDGVAVIEDE